MLILKRNFNGNRYFSMRNSFIDGTKLQNRGRTPNQETKKKKNLQLDVSEEK